MWSGGRDLEQKVARALDCIGKGAAALSEAGTAVYTMSNAMQKQGLGGLLLAENWMQSSKREKASRSARPEAPTPLEPADAEEKRAILKVRFDRAMAERNYVLVKQIARELDEIEAFTSQGASKEERMRAQSPPYPQESTAAAHTTFSPPGVQDRPRDDMSESHSEERSHRGALNVNEGVDARQVSSEHTTSPASPFAHLSTIPSDQTPPPWYCNWCRPSYCPTHMNCPLQNIHLVPNLAYQCHAVKPNERMHSLSATISASNVPSVYSQHNLGWMENGRMAASCTTRHCIPPSMPPSTAHYTVSEPLPDAREFPQLTEPRVFLSMRSSIRSARGGLVEASPAGDTVVDLDALRHEPRPMPLYSSLPSSEIPPRLAESPSAALSTPVDAEYPVSSNGLLLLEMRHREGADDNPPTSPVPSHTSSNRHQLDSDGSSVPGEDLSGNVTHSTHTDQPDHPGAPLQDIYEVDRVLAMRHDVNGHREFLIRWKGWGPKWDNWEPEEHILDKRMLRKFNKKRPVEPCLTDADDFTMQSKRRCAKQAAVKARIAARKESTNGD